MVYAYEFHVVANLKPIIVCQGNYSVWVFLQVIIVAEVVKLCHQDRDGG